MRNGNVGDRVMTMGGGVNYNVLLKGSSFACKMGNVGPCGMTLKTV